MKHTPVTSGQTASDPYHAELFFKLYLMTSQLAAGVYRADPSNANTAFYLACRKDNPNLRRRKGRGEAPSSRSRMSKAEVKSNKATAVHPSSARLDTSTANRISDRHKTLQAIYFDLTLATSKDHF